MTTKQTADGPKGVLTEREWDILDGIVPLIGDIAESCGEAARIDGVALLKMLRSFVTDHTLNARDLSKLN